MPTDDESRYSCMDCGEAEITDECYETGDGLCPACRLREHAQARLEEAAEEVESADAELAEALEELRDLEARIWDLKRIAAMAKRKLKAATAEAEAAGIDVAAVI